jgi:acetyltransferase-like isoleucine patch superfamily enzyme
MHNNDAIPQTRTGTGLRGLIERAMKKVRGKGYGIDSTIPVWVLICFSVRRTVWLARGFIKLLFLQGRMGFVFVGPRVELRNASYVHFGRAVSLESGVIVDGLAERGVRLGDRVTIGAYSIVRSTGVLSRVGIGVEIGDDSSMDAYCFIGAAGGVEIGKKVIMGQHVSFHAEEHNFDDLSLPIKDQGTRRAGIVVEDDCWIGSNVTLLDGAHVGRGCVIGAGSVVKGKIPNYAIAVGAPARPLRSRVDATGK